MSKFGLVYLVLCSKLVSKIGLVYLVVYSKLLSQIGLVYLVAIKEHSFLHLVFVVLRSPRTMVVPPCILGPLGKPSMIMVAPKRFHDL